MILSIIGILLGVIAIGLFIWLKKEQQIDNGLHAAEVDHMHQGMNALMSDFSNYQVDSERKIVGLEKQLEYENNKVHKRIDKNENELPKVIRNVVGHIEFARPLDKK
tara:strand:- start:1262 stop:1582 length:321 start_codon:yes stop_codon:yes gene_type:complete